MFAFINIPKLGMRNIKTAISVLLSIIVLRFGIVIAVMANSYLFPLKEHEAEAYKSNT